MKKMIKRRTSGILLSLVLILGMMPVLGLSTPSYAAETTTVTWGVDDLRNPKHDDSRYVVTIGDITLDAADYIGVDDSGNAVINSQTSEGTFTVKSGLITKIVISGTEISGFEGSGWSVDSSNGKVTWTGDPGSGSVTFKGYISHVTKVEFTIGPAPENYPVWVAGKQVTNYNNDDVFNDGKVKFKPSINGGSATLVLNGFTCTMDPRYKNCAIYIEDGVPNLEIYLQGENEVSGAGTDGDGVYFAGSNLTFIGDGTLNAFGMHSGINASAGNLSVRGATLNASSNKYNGYGIYAGSNVSIYKGTVIASATVGDESYGIYAKGGTVAIEGNGSTVIAAGGSQAIYDIVKNGDAGVGWTDVQGTSAENTIDIDRDGQRLWMFKKVQFPAYSGEPEDDETATDSGKGSAGSTKVKGVNTGDENDLRAWTVLFCTALTGTAGMAFARKRRGQ